MGLTEEEQELLDWLEEQDYYIEAGVVEEEFPNVEINFRGGVTCICKDGKTLVPKRDYRDVILHGTPLD